MIPFILDSTLAWIALRGIVCPSWVTLLGSSALLIVPVVRLLALSPVRPLPLPLRLLATKLPPE